MHRIGLAATILIAASAALAVALQTAVPVPLPGVALGSVELYRAEIAFGIFVAIYVPLALIVLALNGWLLVKLGTTGAEFSHVVGAQSVAVESLAHSIAELQGGLRESRFIQERMKETIADHLQSRDRKHEEERRELEARLASVEAQLRGDNPGGRRAAGA